jgi:hypothetical protein
MRKKENGPNDVFAQIAQEGMNFENKGLIIPEPLEKEEKVLPLTHNSNHANFKPLQKMHTAEELQLELERQREFYSQFMRDLAPPISSNRHRIYFTEFNWRMQSHDDIKNFDKVLAGEGNWEKVNVPHYGGPIGKAVAYYFTSFNLTEENLASDAVFLCFKGVDYKAHVFINHFYLGSHEGFFAPFEFDFTKVAKLGTNTLLVVVENDFVCGRDGNKIYAATGLGYDDPQVGWHHCPPGMGIYQDVYIETRSGIHIHDIFVRPIPKEKKAEAWIEVFSCLPEKKDITLEISLYGQNFDDVVFSGIKYKPTSMLEVGMGDSPTEAEYRSAGILGKSIPLYTSNGINYFKIPFDIPNMRWWEPESPWLYQLQVKVLDENENVLDAQKSQFGMRSFTMDTTGSPKGALYLNGRRIRLRGANTMGHEQQCVYKKDWDQLRDDILLAKICNMNFWRLTQRPVQPEVYDYCDKLGLMTQTDLPLFGVLRRNQFCEAVKQAEEMERLIRSHPCNIMISYINEPFPNASNRPHLHLERNELMDFFTAADKVVHLNNPDRVIKHIDGDYDPPSDSLPDNHCYPAWYNGHGIDLGRLNKGYWLPVKPNWYYGCGEFGAEGLDPVCVMRKYYPPEWLPQSAEEEKQWSPNGIVGAQTGKFHYFFFETPNTLEDWVQASQKHQAWATRFMTEAFRRDWRMTTFAIHLFIDAFPSGWMKTIMDVERRPKPAYFAYRDALTPLMVSLRCDRYKVFSGDEINLEAWICNDLNHAPENAVLNYRVEMNKEIIYSGNSKAEVPICSSAFQGYIRFKAPEVKERCTLNIRLGLIVQNHSVLHDTELEIEVFPQKTSKISKRSAYIVGQQGKAMELATDFKLLISQKTKPEVNDIILIDDYEAFAEQEEQLLEVVKQGATAVFLELAPGEYEVFGNKFEIKICGMLPLHFVSRNTGHLLVEGFKQDDFRLWYDPEVDYITPLLETTFTTETDFNEVLTSGNIDSAGKWNKALAAAEKKIGKGRLLICQVKLAGRTNSNPIANIFAHRLLNLN